MEILVNVQRPKKILGSKKSERNLSQSLDGITDEAQLVELIPALTRALGRVSNDNDWVINKLTFDAFEKNGFHLSTNNYYSVIPDVSKLNNSIWKTPTLSNGLATARKTKTKNYLRHANELKDIEAAENPDNFYWDNGMFPPLDAMIYYGIVREHHPQKIVEIGSGFSSEIAMRALAKNTRGELTCIEPYPTKRLRAKLKKPHRLLQQKIEAKSLEATFKSLQAGDILFVDSSHTVKVGSDVNYIVFNILPLLKKGVIVHFHDIFLPYEYPKQWIKDFRLLWNEQHLLLAFLMFNNQFSVLAKNYEMSQLKQKELEKRFANFDIFKLTRNMSGPKGASFWMVRE